MTKYPYIGKFLNPLISSANGLVPFEGFHYWAFCIVEEECGLNLHCLVPSQLQIYEYAEQINAIVPKTDVKFVCEIDCSASEDYSELLGLQIPTLEKLQGEEWTKTAKLISEVLEIYEQRRSLMES